MVHNCLPIPITLEPNKLTHYTENMADCKVQEINPEYAEELPALHREERMAGKEWQLPMTQEKKKFFEENICFRVHWRHFKQPNKPSQVLPISMRLAAILAAQGDAMSGHHGVYKRKIEITALLMVGRNGQGLRGPHQELPLMSNLEERQLTIAVASTHAQNNQAQPKDTRWPIRTSAEVWTKQEVHCNHHWCLHQVDWTYCHHGLLGYHRGWGIVWKIVHQIRGTIENHCKRRQGVLQQAQWWADDPFRHKASHDHPTSSAVQQPGWGLHQKSQDTSACLRTKPCRIGKYTLHPWKWTQTANLHCSRCQ